MSLWVPYDSQRTAKVKKRKRGAALIPCFFVLFQATAPPIAPARPQSRIREHPEGHPVWRPSSGKQPTARPLLRFKDFCKHALTVLGSDCCKHLERGCTRPHQLETAATRGSSDRREHGQMPEEKRKRRQLRRSSNPKDIPLQMHQHYCHRDYHSLVGMINHNRLCSTTRPVRPQQTLENNPPSPATTHAAVQPEHRNRHCKTTCPVQLQHTPQYNPPSPAASDTAVQLEHRNRHCSTT